MTQQKTEDQNYKEIAKKSRIKVLELIYRAQSSHIGSCFSVADIMAVLCEKVDWDKDKLVLSAGWKAAMLYYHLWRKGRITEEQLNSYCQDGSPFIGLAEPIIPEITIAGGSMGLGLPGAVGLALAKKFKGEEGKVYVLMSDGELAIGTTWESILIAKQHNLDNLRIFVDWNGFQAMGKVTDILRPWIPFPYSEVDGHNYESINLALDEGRQIVMCHTTKGKGVSFFEGDNMWHYRAPNQEHYEAALKELNAI